MTKQTYENSVICVYVCVCVSYMNQAIDLQDSLYKKISNLGIHSPGVSEISDISNNMADGRKGEAKYS